jgi:hypothetical protein
MGDRGENVLEVPLQRRTPVEDVPPALECQHHPSAVRIDHFPHASIVLAGGAARNPLLRTGP